MSGERERAAGVLLHLTSLPGPGGAGDLGEAAYRFVDFLARAGQSIWQFLPVNPTAAFHQHSPYHSISAFAGNPLLISPEQLARDGLVPAAELPRAAPPGPRTDPAVLAARAGWLADRAPAIRERLGDRYDAFLAGHGSRWLDDFALFAALKGREGRHWNEWPAPLRDRDPAALAAAAAELAPALEREKVIQCLFFSQWQALKAYANERGVRFFGDLPIYVDGDSADVWVRPGIFRLDEAKRPAVVAGVPPDYFSATGQLWGNPVYDWEALKARGYDWWLERIRHNLTLVDQLRIDHFRGLVAYWEVPAGEKSAVNGRWVPAPVDDFLGRVSAEFPALPFVAEDLGLITDDVRAAMRRFKLMGMKVLLFAFDDDKGRNPYLPHNLEPDCVVYTGTHDNNTVRGWLKEEADRQTRRRLWRYLGRQVAAEKLPAALVGLALGSVARQAVIPLQDHLALGADARMNCPASPAGENWRWRVGDGLLTAALADRLAELTAAYGRARR